MSLEDKSAQILKNLILKDSNRTCSIQRVLQINICGRTDIRNIGNRSQSQANRILIEILVLQHYFDSMSGIRKIFSPKLQISDVCRAGRGWLSLLDSELIER